MRDEPTVPIDADESAIPILVPDRPLEAGTELGRYTLLGQRGKGGGGTVYEAFDPKLDRKIAIKLLRSPVTAEEDGGSGEEVELLREAKALAKLSHPNVVPVYDVGTLAGRVFMAMELVDGVDLRQWLETNAPRRKADPTRLREEILSLFIEAGRGLAAAHGVGIVHRDFKPGNVLVGEDGRVRVADFGLAVAADEQKPPLNGATASSTSEPEGEEPPTSLVRGTPPYMPPERHDGQQTDARGDQYSYCVALYEALFGERPFIGDDTESLLVAKRRGLEEIDAGALGVSKRIRRAIRRGLQPSPAARFDSMDALLAELSPGVVTRHRFGLTVIGGVLGAAAAALLLSEREAPCEGPEGSLEGLWTPDARDQLASAIRGSELPYAATLEANVLGHLDEYTVGWTDAWQQACEATHVRREASQELFDRRMACLGRGRRALEVVVEYLGLLDEETASSARDAVAHLPRVDRCLDASMAGTEPAPSPPPEHHRELERISLLRKVGHFEEAAEAGRALLDSVDAEGITAARARAQLAMSAMDAGEHEAAEELAYTAAAQAERLGDHVTVGSSFLILSGINAQYSDRPREGERMAEFAIAAFERAGNDGYVASAYSALGLSLDRQSDSERALEAFETALEVARGQGAQDHEVSYILSNIGMVQARRAQWEDAHRTIIRTVELMESAYGDTHPQLAMPLMNLVSVCRHLERFDEALEHARRAENLITANHGPEHHLHGIVFMNEASVLRDLGRLDEALALYGRVAQLLASAVGPEHFDVAHAEYSHATTQFELGNREEGLRELEAVVDKFDRVDHPVWASHAKLELAKQLWNDDPQRSRSLAEVALRQATAAEANDERDGAIDELNQWLREHPN